MITSHQTFRILQYHAHATTFTPEAPPKAVAVLIHGQGDFSSRYDEVAHIFTQNGVAIIGIDLPGHGHTSGPRGDIPNIETATAFIAHAYQTISDQFPGLPIGLLAHSMGGQLALRELLFSDRRYQFCWLNAPLINPRHNKHPLELWTLQRLISLCPTLNVSTGVKRKLCRRPASPTQKINPLFHKRISLRWGQELIDSAEQVRTQAPLHRLETPVLITQGDLDTVTPAAFAQGLISSVDWPHLEFALLPDALHEPFRDISQESCLSIIQHWLQPVLADLS